MRSEVEGDLLPCGPYDCVGIWEAPDEQSMSALHLERLG
jgi:uncharacterized protein with GYD domain